MNLKELKKFYPELKSFPDKYSMLRSCLSLPLLDLTPYKEKIKGIIF